MALQTQSMPRHSTALLAVICLHIGLIYLLTTGLATRTFQLFTSPLTVVPVDNKPLPRAPPPPPQTQLEPVKPDLPVTPDIRIDTPPDTAAAALTPSTERAQPLEPPPTVVRVAGGVGKGFPNTGDFYPPSAIRLGQQGATAVRVCVDESGRLTGEPSVARSSNIDNLDAAALRLARAGSGHYRPATENGRPVSSCYPITVRFNIKP